MKIVFAGTPDFAVAPLQALIESHQVVAVLTQPDRKAGRGKKLSAPPVKRVALEHDIPVYQPSSLKDQQALIASFNADVMVVVAYGMLLPQAILDIPKHGCINIHASILPRWRGAAPIQRAIESGDAETGVSIMQMEAGLDTGPVYQILRTPITATDTSATMHDKLAELGAQGICSTLAQLELKPDLSASEQDSNLSSYAAKINKSEGHIDWTRPAAAIDCQVRAFIPWPVCQTMYQGQRLRVWQCQPLSQTHTSEPGTILEVSADGVSVACGHGRLLLQTLQRDGGKPMAVKDMLNGFAIAVGDRFSGKEKGE